jgi:hypothetical protein
LHDAASTAKLLVGATLNQATYMVAAKALAAEIAANPSADPRHTLAYRQNLAAGFLYKLFLHGALVFAPWILPPTIYPAMLCKLFLHGALIFECLCTMDSATS